MEMIPVESSNISQVGYDGDNKVLKIEFINGRAYEYTGVTRGVYDELLKADSKGKYAAQFIYKSFEQKRI